MYTGDLGRLPDFSKAIAELPVFDVYARNQLITQDFAIAVEGNLEVFYAPFDHVNPSAQLMLVGITPGWTQMEASFVAARHAIATGLSDAEILRQAKRVAAFSGPLRNNLVSMLDDIGLPDALAISTTADLFAPEAEPKLQATSMLRYPVFNKGKNYSGTPAVAAQPLLEAQLGPWLTELTSVPSALIVPLGKAVTTVLEHQVTLDEVERERCLFGFPHPSPAHALRKTEFAKNRDQMTLQVSAWFD
jgi:hypothetical protein